MDGSSRENCFGIGSVTALRSGRGRRLGLVLCPAQYPDDGFRCATPSQEFLGPLDHIILSPHWHQIHHSVIAALRQELRPCSSVQDRCSARTSFRTRRGTEFGSSTATPRTISRCRASTSCRSRRCWGPYCAQIRRPRQAWRHGIRRFKNAHSPIHDTDVHRWRSVKLRSPARRVEDRGRSCGTRNNRRSPSSRAMAGSRPGGRP